jgi:transcriptional regulator with XRE-family HTH domain
VGDHDPETLAGRLNLLFRSCTKDDGSEYSLREVADAINASGGTISHAQIGFLRAGTKDNPNLKHLRSLAEFFGVPVGYLAGDPGTEIHIERLAQRREATRDLSVADEFYLITHDSRTGRPRLHQHALQVGLAAGLLAELLLAQALHIDVDQRRLELGPPDRVPDERLAQDVFGLLKQEQHGLRTWLDFFAHTSVDDVALRLERAGLVRPKVSRRMFKDHTSWIPTDPAAAAQSRARLGYRLRQAQGPTDLAPVDYALVGLVAATDFDTDLLAGASARTRHTFELVSHSIWPEPRCLFDEARALIGTTILGSRV